MPVSPFNTVPEELLGVAAASAEHFRTLGYTVRIEKRELGFPYTPTLLCRRKPTTLVVEVDHVVRHDRIKSWVAYGKSAGRDFRVALCGARDHLANQPDANLMRTLGIGCFLFDGSLLRETLAASDLALNVQLPAPSSLPVAVKRLLGHAYEQFGRGEWREGFQTAAEAFEEASRRYLRKHTKNGRIVFLDKHGKPRGLTQQRIKRMTMGNLAVAFSQIRNKNKADSVIGQALLAINPDRIGMAHRRSQVRTESRLRVNVGRHMWSLVEASKEAVM
jgi:hypothetical protein